MSDSTTMLKAFLDLHAPLKDYGKMRLIQDAWRARDDEIEALRKQLAELEARGTFWREAADALQEKLTACQDRETKLREDVNAIQQLACYPEDVLKICRDTLSLPFDDSALQERLKQERERCAKLFEDADGAIHEATAVAWRDPAAAIRALT